MKFKGVDTVGRVRAYGEGLISSAEFLFACAFLERECLTSGGSRWACRALVPHGTTVTEESIPLLERGGPLEINRLAVRIDSEDLDYLWVARNLHDRSPTSAAVERFGAEVQDLIEYQSEYSAHFHNHSARMISEAEERGLRLICRDPNGEWGDRPIDLDLAAAALRQLFYVSPADAARITKGHGYSQHGHYLFGLEDASGDVLAMFILAQFDWGFEGTYTIVNSLLPRRQTTGAARLLMLLSNALVLARHGSGTLLYGEANVYNIRACISAGYEIVRPHFSPRLHENVVWRDNPIGKLVDTHNELRGPPPGYRDQLYVDYALMRAKNEVILPFSSAAQHFAGMS